MIVTNKFRLLFISLVVLVIYYPTIFAGVTYTDDYRTLLNLEEIKGINLAGIFTPGGGYYYRPLLASTFLFDRLAWGLEPSFMHLENIIIHLVNSILVFKIAERVFRDDKGSELPLLSSLLFALHPINTEAVNWISGRTDPLAASFVLLSVICIMKGMEDGRFLFIVLSSLLIFVGALAKEVALFFFPVAAFITYCCYPEKRGSSFIEKIRLIFPFVVGTALYFALRSLAFMGNDGSVNQAVGQIAVEKQFDILNYIRISFKVFGFYVKKLFVPLPLNFAIVKISDLYVLLGAGAFLVSLIFLLFRRRNFTAVLLAVSLYLITPAIIVALGRVAWTPVAERYIYLPSAFFSIAIIGILSAFMQGKEGLFKGGIAVVIITAALLTADRNILWKDKLKLYQDTARKSPEFSAIMNDLGIAMMKSGRAEEADRLFDAARDKMPDNALLHLNQAKLKAEKGDPDAGREILLKAINDTKNHRLDVLNMLVLIDEIRLRKALDKERMKVITEEIIATRKQIYEKNRDTFQLYRVGQLELSLDNKQAAAENFKKAADEAPYWAYYKDAARKLAINLGKK